MSKGQMWGDFLTKLLDNLSTYTPHLREALNIDNETFGQWLHGQAIPNDWKLHLVMFEELSIKSPALLAEYCQCLGRSLFRLRGDDKDDVLAEWLCRQMAKLNCEFNALASEKLPADSIMELFNSEMTLILESEQLALAETLNEDVLTIQHHAKKQGELFGLDMEAIQESPGEDSEESDDVNFDDEDSSDFEEDNYQEDNSEDDEVHEDTDDDSFEEEYGLEFDSESESESEDFDLEEALKAPQRFMGINLEKLHPEDPGLNLSEWFQGCMEAFGFNYVSELCRDKLWTISPVTTGKYANGKSKLITGDSKKLIAAFFGTSPEYVQARLEIQLGKKPKTDKKAKAKESKKPKLVKITRERLLECHKTDEDYGLVKWLETCREKFGYPNNNQLKADPNWTLSNSATWNLFKGNAKGSMRSTTKEFLASFFKTTEDYVQSRLDIDLGNAKGVFKGEVLSGAFSHDEAVDEPLEVNQPAEIPEKTGPKPNKQAEAKTSKRSDNKNQQVYSGNPTVEIQYTEDPHGRAETTTHRVSVDPDTSGMEVAEININFAIKMTRKNTDT